MVRSNELGAHRRVFYDRSEAFLAVIFILPRPEDNIVSLRVDTYTRKRVRFLRQCRSPDYLVKSQYLWGRLRGLAGSYPRLHLRRVVRGRVPRDLNFGYRRATVRPVNL